MGANNRYINILLKQKEVGDKRPEYNIDAKSVETKKKNTNMMTTRTIPHM